MNSVGDDVRDELQARFCSTDASGEPAGPAGPDAPGQYL